MLWNFCCLPACLPVFPADLLSSLSASPSVCLSIPTACLGLLHVIVAFILCLSVPPGMISPSQQPGVCISVALHVRGWSGPSSLSWSMPLGSTGYLGPLWSLFCYCLSLHLSWWFAPWTEGLLPVQLSKPY